MQSKVIFTVLIMLSFSIFHDSFIALLEKSEQSNIVHYIGNEVPYEECAEFNEIHSMFHFLAIVDMYTNDQIHVSQKESIPHHLIQYTPPLEETSYKPPIA